MEYCCHLFGAGIL